jgi:hypothetical protein
MDFDNVKNEHYINPEIGHQCILSHKALNGIMLNEGFKLEEEINRNVFMFKMI